MNHFIADGVDARNEMKAVLVTLVVLGGHGLPIGTTASLGAFTHFFLFT